MKSSLNNITNTCCKAVKTLQLPTEPTFNPFLPLVYLCPLRIGSNNVLCSICYRIIHILKYYHSYNTNCNYPPRRIRPSTASTTSNTCISRPSNKIFTGLSCLESED
ncbi:hypothetical protein I312_102933 [Cryptococcus bacillisporus CA1280]|uniref:uncharacterized protein n=1 Tax=Cryptococcus bacillisporus CA1280 TaxID=1296109 RepID=UPI00336663F1